MVRFVHRVTGTPTARSSSVASKLIFLLCIYLVGLFDSNKLSRIVARVVMVAMSLARAYVELKLFGMAINPAKRDFQALVSFSECRALQKDKY